MAEVWRTTGGRVVPLAPSATAAEVLGLELGCRAENLHKFRHTHDPAPTGRPDDPWFVLEPGDLVLVDEAGMAGTRNLDWLTHYTRERGAVVRMLGDPAQLTSVEAGGALRLLAHDAGAVEVTVLHRFTDPGEATATIGIREGRPEALDFYLTHDRVHSGSTDAMLEAAYDAWERDTRAGLSSLLIAQSGGDVTALNVRARTARIAAGLVNEAGSNFAIARPPGSGTSSSSAATNASSPAATGTPSSRTATPGPSNGYTPTATSPSAPSSAPGASSDSPATTSSQTSSSDTPPPPHARKAAPSTPPTYSSTRQ